MLCGQVGCRGYSHLAEADPKVFRHSPIQTPPSPLRHGGTGSAGLTLTAADLVGHFLKGELKVDGHPSLDRSRRVFHAELVRMMGMTVRQYQEGEEREGPVP